MVRGTGVYSTTLSDLTSPANYPGDTFNLEIVPIDPDGLSTNKSGSLSLLYTAGIETAWNEYVDRNGNFIIGTIPQLTMLSNDCGTGGVSCSSDFILVSDIDMSGETFHPIGGVSVAPTTPIGTFTGTFNGNNKTISNLTINEGTFDYVGLFSAVSGTINNLTLTNANISGDQYTGSVAGYAAFANLTNIISTGGSVTGLTDFTGGIAGYIDKSTLTNSYSSGNISGGWTVGGLVGDNFDSSITNCYTSGNVFGSTEVGGISGSNSSNSIIMNSYSIGNISGSSQVGGLIGYNSGNSVITNSYSTGIISGSNRLGGIVGTNDGATVSKSYASGNILGNSVRVGGVVGDNQWGAILNSYATGTVSCSSDCGGFLGFDNAGAGAFVNNYRYFDHAEDTTDGNPNHENGALDLTPSNFYDPNTNFGMSWDTFSTWTFNTGTYPTLR